MTIRACVLLGLLSVLAPACVVEPTDEATTESEDELRALAANEIVGTLAYGETSPPTPYTKTPLYRAYRFQGQPGDKVEAWVRSTNGDARAWLLRPTFGTIASNANAAPGTTDARVEATLTQSGTFYIVFRETTGKNATFTVSLKKLNAATTCGLPPVLTPKWEAIGGRPDGLVLFDAKRNRLVSLGGNGTSERTANGWSTPLGDPLPPGRRYAAALAYDSDRGRAVLFGGYDDAAREPLNDTWEWDGATNTWTKITPSGLIPRGRQGHAITYDPIRKRVVLYGGLAGSQTQDMMEDTWTWDGAAWTRVGTAAAPHPEGRIGATMAFDATRGRVVLYGNYGPWMLGPIGGPNTSKANTWEWDGALWRKAAEGGSRTSDDPGQLPMVFDTRRGRVVRVEPVGARYQKRFALLEWNGQTWANVGGESPPSVDGASATSYSGAYDVARERFVLASTGYPWRTQEHFIFEEPNRAPALEIAPAARAFAGEELSLRFAASDADGHPVTYSASPLPAGATLDAASGVLRWTPTVAQAGTHAITVKATDGCAESTKPLTITVDHLAYAGLPSGDVKLGGTVQVPVIAWVPNRPSAYEGNAELSCNVSGANPGKVTVTCEGHASTAYAYQSGSYSFTPETVAGVVEPDLKFRLSPGTPADGRAFAGWLEPLSDGTYKLHIQTFAMPLQSGARIEKNSRWAPTSAYGVIDAVP